MKEWFALKCFIVYAWFYDKYLNPNRHRNRTDELVKAQRNEGKNS